MSCRMLISLAWLLPLLAAADRVHNDDCENNGAISPDWKEASVALLTELRSNETVAESKSSDPAPSQPDEGLLSHVKHAIAKKIYSCSSWSTCGECASDKCAWVADEEIFDPSVLGSKNKDALVRIKNSLESPSATKAEGLVQKGTCKDHADLKEGDDRYVAVTSSPTFSYPMYSFFETGFRWALVRDFYPKKRMIMLQGSESCPNLAKAFGMEAKAYAEDVDHLIKVETKKEQAKLQALEERKKAMEEHTYDIPTLLDKCKKGSLPGKYFVNSDHLAAGAWFDDRMMRFGPNFEAQDWVIVDTLQKTVPDGNFYHPVEVNFEKRNGDLKAIVFQGRHRICAMYGKGVSIEVEVTCNNMKKNEVRDIFVARDDCNRAKSAYDNKQKDVEDQIAKEQAKAATKNQYDPMGMMKHSGVGGPMGGNYGNGFQ